MARNRAPCGPAGPGVRLRAPCASNHRFRGIAAGDRGFFARRFASDCPRRPHAASLSWRHPVVIEVACPAAPRAPPGWRETSTIRYSETTMNYFGMLKKEAGFGGMR
jgi:hypothetical protein